MGIIVKSKAQLDCMREGGKILAEVHRVLKDALKVGVSAAFLDQLAYDTIRSYHAEPSFLGYRGYEHTICASRNEEIVHGIPYAEKVFFPGDVCSIDIGVYYKGFHVDAARSHIVDVALDPEVQRLVDVTKASFFECVKFAQPKARLSDISHALQSYAEGENFAVVRDLYSHGIGAELHEDPLIPNFGKPGKGPVLKEGMTFAIEPMLNMGTTEVLTLQDKWTIITADQKWSAHYENTIVVTQNGPEILTLGTEGD